MSSRAVGDLLVSGDLSDDERALFDQVELARRERRTIVAPEPEPTLASAYRVQQTRFAGCEVRGYKVGMVSPAKMAQFGLSSPVHGPLLDEMSRSGDVALTDFIQPRLEPELVIVTNIDLEAGATPGQVAHAVSGFFLGVDILDTVWTDYRCRPAHAVADGLNGGAFLVGDQLLPLDIEGQLSLRLNGELIADGALADLGEVTARIAWLTSEVGGLRAGSLVFLGSPVANVTATSGLLELHGPLGSMLFATLRDGSS